MRTLLISANTETINMPALPLPDNRYKSIIRDHYGNEILFDGTSTANWRGYRQDSFPAEGWDKLIFPMKLCNDFLESMVATRETVKSYFARN